MIYTYYNAWQACRISELALFNLQRGKNLYVSSMRISVVILCSAVLLFHGVNCHRFPAAVRNAVQLLGNRNQYYKRQSDTVMGPDQCVLNELERSGTSEKCRQSVVGDLEETNDVESDGDLDQASIDAMFRVLCEPECGNAFIDAQEECVERFDELKVVDDFLIGLCASNERGERCYERYVSIANVIVLEFSCSANFTTDSECDCQSDLRMAVEREGCCLDIYQDFFSIVAENIPSLTYEIEELYEVCDVNIPERCDDSPLSGSVPLISTVTVMTAFLLSLVGAQF